MLVKTHSPPPPARAHPQKRPRSRRQPGRVGERDPLKAKPPCANDTLINGEAAPRKFLVPERKQGRKIQACRSIFFCVYDTSGRPGKQRGRWETRMGGALAHDALSAVKKLRWLESDRPHTKRFTMHAASCIRQSAARDVSVCLWSLWAVMTQD